MKKRAYIVPSVQIIDTCETYIVCSSIPIFDEETNATGRGQERRGTWGNFWENNKN